MGQCKLAMEKADFEKVVLDDASQFHVREEILAKMVTSTARNLVCIV